MFMLAILFVDKTKIKYQYIYNINIHQKINQYFSTVDSIDSNSINKGKLEFGMVGS